MVDQAVYGCTCPPPREVDGGWTHEWRENCPVHGPYVRSGLVPAPGTVTMDQIVATAGEAIHDAACSCRSSQSGEPETCGWTEDSGQPYRAGAFVPMANAVLAAVAPLIEVRLLRQVAVMLRSNMGADEIPEPGDRLDRWADNWGGQP